MDERRVRPADMIIVDPDVLLLTCNSVTPVRQKRRCSIFTLLQRLLHKRGTKRILQNFEQYKSDWK